MTCSLGHRHWGLHGAAGLLLEHDGAVLLQHRAEWSHQGGTWGVPGGALAPGESPLGGALREAHEEAGVAAADVEPGSAWTLDHGTWSYTTVLGSTPRRFEPVVGDAESLALEWVPIAEVTHRPLHPALAVAWPRLAEQAGRRLVLLVDAANVVGSRPDGWWHDRQGAAERLRDALAGLRLHGVAADDLTPRPAPEEVTRWWPQVHLVVEGQARGVRGTSAVRVVSARGSGDDALVEAAAAHRRERADGPVLAVTADRALRARLDRLGVPSAGPGWLLDLLERT